MISEDTINCYTTKMRQDSTEINRQRTLTLFAFRGRARWVAECCTKMCDVCATWRLEGRQLLFPRFYPLMPRPLPTCCISIESLESDL